MYFQKYLRMSRTSTYVYAIGGTKVHILRKLVSLYVTSCAFNVIGIEMDLEANNELSFSLEKHTFVKSRVLKSN